MLKETNDQNCPSDSILINGQRVAVVANCYKDRYSSFEFQADSGATVEWNFGDDTDVENDHIASHKFTKEGTYQVRATVNGNCRYDFLVEVIDNPIFSGNREKPVIEVYADPMRPGIGSTVKLYCVADIPSIVSYQWKVSGTNTVKNDVVPAFIFRNEGNYTIELVINGDTSLTTRVVVVVAANPQDSEESDLTAGLGGMPPAIGPLVNLDPPGLSNKDQPLNAGSGNDQGLTKPPADSSKIVDPARAREIDPVAFKDLLQNVVNEDGKELEDLYEYLDYKASTMVKVNESGSLKSLTDFCKNMREKKKKKRQIKSVTFKLDDKKSIQIINVKIPESGGLFGGLFN